MTPTATDTPTVVTVSTQAGLRHHKATCNRIRREQIVGDPRTYVDPDIPLGTCCKLKAEDVAAVRGTAAPAQPEPVKPQPTMQIPEGLPATARKVYDGMTVGARDALRHRAQELFAKGGGLTLEQAWIDAANEVVKAEKAEAKKAPPAKAAAPEKAAATKKAADQVVEPGPEKPSVTYYVNGRPRLQRTSPRPYTFSYLAGETVGGKGSSGKLRDLLAKAGITDPEHTSWDYTLPNGKTIGARVEGDAPPAVPEKATRAEKATASMEKLDALKAESAALKAWKADGEKGERPATPLHDAAEAAEAEKKAAAEAAKAERAAAEKAAAEKKAAKRQEAAKGAA